MTSFLEAQLEAVIAGVVKVFVNVPLVLVNVKTFPVIAESWLILAGTIATILTFTSLGFTPGGTSDALLEMI